MGVVGVIGLAVTAYGVGYRVGRDACPACPEPTSLAGLVDVNKPVFATRESCRPTDATRAVVPPPGERLPADWSFCDPMR